MLSTQLTNRITQVAERLRRMSPQQALFSILDGGVTGSRAIFLTRRGRDGEPPPMMVDYRASLASLDRNVLGEVPIVVFGVCYSLGAS